MRLQCIYACFNVLENSYHATCMDISILVDAHWGNGEEGMREEREMNTSNVTC